MRTNTIESFLTNSQELAATRQFLMEQNQNARQNIQRLYHHQMAIRKQQLVFEQRLDDLQAKLNRYKADYPTDQASPSVN